MGSGSDLYRCSLCGRTGMGSYDLDGLDIGPICTEGPANCLDAWTVWRFVDALGRPFVVDRVWADTSQRQVAALLAVLAAPCRPDQPLPKARWALLADSTLRHIVQYAVTTDRADYMKDHAVCYTQCTTAPDNTRLIRSDAGA